MNKKIILKSLSVLIFLFYFFVPWSWAEGITAEKIPLNRDKLIYSLKISGEVNLNSEKGLTRAVLVSKEKREYLIYEASAYIEENKIFKITDSCEETCVLDGVVPDYIRIEGEEATLTITNKIITDNKEKLAAGINRTNLIGEQRSILTNKITAKIQKIKTVLAERNQKWIAGETSVSKLTYEEKKRLFMKPEGATEWSLPNLQGFEYYKEGVFEVENTNQSTGTSPTTAGVVYPTYFDWRNRHGENWMTPVREQGGCASCWIFASTGATEGLINIYYNQLINADLSEQEILCQYPKSCKNGGSPDMAMTKMINQGSVTEVCYPYLDKEECKGKCLGGENNLWRIRDYQYYGNNDEEIIDKLITKGPLTFGISSWWHVMTLVGYEKDLSNYTTIWMIKNSWGTSWGENGYVRMIVPTQDRYLLNYPIQPFFPANPNLYQISCTDKDNDTYCNWGITETKPVTCPAFCKAEKDCDDSNPAITKETYCNSPTINTTPTPSQITLTRVEIEPPAINADILHDNFYGLSALAYDQNNQAVFSGVTYEWGISSDNGIGMLNPINGNVTNFNILNSGTGSIFVTAEYKGKLVSKGIPVTVSALKVKKGGNKILLPTNLLSNLPFGCDNYSYKNYHNFWQGNEVLQGAGGGYLTVYLGCR